MLCSCEHTCVVDSTGQLAMSVITGRIYYQFIMLAIAEKMASMATEDYLEQRAKQGSREKLLAVLAKAPHVEPEEADRLPA